MRHYGHALHRAPQPATSRSYRQFTIISALISRRLRPMLLRARGAMLTIMAARAGGWFRRAASSALCRAQLICRRRAADAHAGFITASARTPR